MSDALREGITYSDGSDVTERPVDNIMSLQPDGTICFLGWAGHTNYYFNKNGPVCIDYEKYIDNSDDYIV